jgi:hypothetical protein
MNRYVSVAAIVAIATALGACDRGATGPKGAFNATFDLKSINGTSLPVDATLGATAMRITSDILILRENGSYEDSTTYAFAAGASTQLVTTLERGTYNMSGSNISFIDQTNGGRYGGAIDGTTLTQSVHGLTPVYQRR